MKEKYLIPYNRYGDKNYFVKVRDNFYRFKPVPDMPYRVIGSLTDFDEKEFAIDPSGGPFISLGWSCDDFKITKIIKENNDYLFKLEPIKKRTVNNIINHFNLIKKYNAKLKEYSSLIEEENKVFNVFLVENPEFDKLVRQSIFNNLSDEEKQRIEKDEKDEQEISWASIGDDCKYTFGSATYAIKDYANPFIDKFRITDFKISKDSTSIQFCVFFDIETESLGSSGYTLPKARYTEYIPIKQINKILK